MSCVRGGRGEFERVVWHVPLFFCSVLGAAIGVGLLWCVEAHSQSYFTAEPVWRSGPAEGTRCLALGDVDGDGDLDLVCGNRQQENTLYRNDRGVFSRDPVRVSGTTEDTWGVALGDVDGDGDLDAVFGNYGQSNTLYLNEGGVFSTDPVWYSGPLAATTSVALGDVDGDGDLDAVFGNYGCLDVVKMFSESPAEDAVRIEVEGLDAISEAAKVYLVDRTLGHVSDPRAEPVYECFVGVRDVVSGEADARFVLLVGSEEFVESHGEELPSLPTQTVLHQNHPNPFNPTTIIRYELATVGIVRLRIYDARGALVRELYAGHRPAGRYEVGWDGLNDRGERVASGVYFYVLETPVTRLTKKMVCIK